MKKSLVILLGVSLSLTLSYAEVFTKAYPKIYNTLKAEKASHFQFVFKSPEYRCTTTIVVRNQDNVVLMKSAHNMQKPQEVFNLSVESGIYDTEMFTHAGCLNKSFELEVKQTSGSYEQEVNNKVSTATPMSENVETIGYLQELEVSKRDIDFYEINMSQRGILELNFKHEKFDNREFFYIELFDEEDQQLFKTKSPLNKKTITKKIGLDKGKYFVKVSTYFAVIKIPNIKYTLSYTFTEVPNHELEYNDKFKNATMLNEDLSVIGHYQEKGQGPSRSDKDYFKYRAKEGSYLLQFEDDDLEHKKTITIKLLDENLDEIYSFSPNRRHIKDTFKLDLKEETYYIVVQNIYHALGQEYKFKLQKMNTDTSK